jgi:trk system potassium uptake protein
MSSSDDLEVLLNRYVVVGLGHFGSFIAKRLYELGNDVVAIDTKPDVVDAHGPFVSRALAGDATKKEVLQEAGAEDADAAIISTGDNLGASVLSLLALRDLSVKAIYVKVQSIEHSRIADALGATETVFPEMQAATNLAQRITSGRLLHYTAYSEQFGIQEMAVPDSWSGKTLQQLRLPVEYQIQVVAVHDNLRDTITIPVPAKPLTPSDTLLIAGAPDRLETLTKVR